MVAKRTEQDIAAQVVEWFEGQGWTVYQEVPNGDATADIVATRPAASTGKLWYAVAEVKTSASLSLLTQGRRWVLRGQAHVVYVACPLPSGPSQGNLPLLAYPLGVVVLDVGFGGVRRCSQERRWRDDVMPDWDLREEHRSGKYAKAGSQGGNRATAFAILRDQILEFMADKPMAHIDDLVELSKHHYRHPKTAELQLRELIGNGKIPGLMVKRNGTVFVSEVTA